MLRIFNIYINESSIKELTMPYITKDGLKQLDNYKYVGGAYSWLDNKMNPFWEWCVRLIPTVPVYLHVVDGAQPRHLYRLDLRDPILCRHAVLRLHVQ
jgi:hypothetical protein